MLVAFMTVNSLGAVGSGTSGLLDVQSSLSDRFMSLKTLQVSKNGTTVYSTHWVLQLCYLLAQRSQDKPEK